MDELNVIYTTIAADGFKAETLQMIDNLTKDIQYGRKDFNGFTLPEHAGLCKGGAPLIGASIVAGYARRSLTTGGNAEGSEGSSPAYWQIDEEQEQYYDKYLNNNLADYEKGKNNMYIDANVCINSINIL